MRFQRKGDNYWTEKVCVFIQMWVFFCLKISEKGSFYKWDNAECPGEYWYQEVQSAGTSGRTARELPVISLSLLAAILMHCPR